MAGRHSLPVAPPRELATAGAPGRLPVTGAALPVPGHAPRLDQAEHIAVFRPLPLGDLLLSVPALRALRAHARRARITLIALPGAQDFARRFPAYIDDFLPFTGAPGLAGAAQSPELLERFFHAAQSRRFDFAFQLHGVSDRANMIVARLGATARTGFTRSAAGGGSDIERCLAVMQALGVPPAGTHLEFPLDQDDRDEAQALLDRHGLKPGAYACVHPGAELRTRRWPIGRFRQVASSLAERGWRIALIGSTDEATLTSALESGLAGAGVDLAGQTTPGGLAALIAGSRLLVCNDTGVSQLGAAVGTPSIVLACGTDIARSAPLDRRRHRVLSVNTPCRPCTNFECPIGHPCAQQLSTAAAIDASRELIRDLG